MSDIFKPSDKKMIAKIKAIQEGLGAYPDGILGPQTLDVIYRKFATVSYPYVEKFFQGIVIYAKDIKIDYSQNKRSTYNHEYSISGVFQWVNEAVSVLISDGKIINNTSAHAWSGHPETIIYRTYHGVIGCQRTTAVPNDLVKDIEWAISGVGMHNYNPVVEGYTGKYSDVLRNTGHTGIGVTNENEIVLLYKSCNGPEFMDWTINKLGLKYAIMLDGGHIASINAEEHKYNTGQKQNNIIIAE